MYINKKKKSEKATFYLIPTIRHSRKDKTMEMVKRSVDSQDSETTLNDAVIKDACHYKLIQTQRRSNTQSELSCKLWSVDDDVRVQVHQL